MAIKQQNYIRQFNSQDWKVTYQLYNYKQKITLSLDIDKVNDIIIDNNIQCFSPTIQFIYYDIGQSLTEYLSVNNLALTCKFIQPRPSDDKYWDDEKLLTLECSFFITEIQILFKEYDNIMYKFHGVHVNQKLLKRTINYATTKQNDDSRGTPKSPLIIIQDILSRVDYPHETFINDTKNKINFLTSQNMNVEDDIKYLLNFTPSNEDPPSYFVHNLRENKCQLINSKILQSRLEKTMFNSFNLIGNNPNKMMDLNLPNQITEITSQGKNGSVKMQPYLGNFYFKNYDHNKRLWKTTKYDYKIISNLFNSGILQKYKNMQTIFPEEQFIDEKKLRFEFPNFNQCKMYSYLRNLQLTTDNIRFKVFGNVGRDAGQYVTINCSNEEQIPKFGGLWFIYGCRHHWSGTMYYNQLLCYRTFKIKPKVKV